jgi:rhamnulokinase
VTVAAVAAVDLGASSGRVMVGRVGGGTLALVEVTRFPNEPVLVHGSLQWDILALYRGVLSGLRAAGREVGQLASVGVDSWGVDYGLLDETGTLLGNPVHYRDARTVGVMERVLLDVPAGELYAATGQQLLSINTLFQLVAARATPAMLAARTFLMIPDLLTFWLTGEIGAEVTNASTTQLFDVSSGTWSFELMRRLAIPTRLFPALRRPGEPAGTLSREVLDRAGLTAPVSVPVTAVGSHDTASAVVSVPAGVDGGAICFISCGTWSLVGLELPEPVLTQASLAANFTNAAGVDGTTLFLRNVMGLWLLQESLRTWNDRGLPADIATLLPEASRVPGFAVMVDADDPSFLAPGDMPARIARLCAATGQTPPQNQAETVRCIVDSLALAHRRAVQTAQRLSGRSVDVVHLVGGGSRNTLLCQLTADACDLPVIAGPVEASALGNVLMQARAVGALSGGLAEMRALVRTTHELIQYQPTGDSRLWEAASHRVPRPG